MESKLIPDYKWSENKEEEKIDWKEEKQNWERTIKCPHCPHQLKRKKLKKHIANIHPSLFDSSKGNANKSGLNAVNANPNRNLPPQPRIPIPQHVKTHIKEMMQCDPWKTKCDYCPYIGENLSRHMLTHTEEGKKILKEEREEIVYCSYCNHETKKKNLRKHIKTMHPHVVDDDTSFNYRPVSANVAPRKIRRPWDPPASEVTVTVENKYPGKAPPFVYNDLYGSFTSGGKSSSNASPSPSLNGPVKSSGPPGGSFTAGDIFPSHTNNESIPDPNRSMNNDYNQKMNSFGPPMKSFVEEIYNQGNGSSYQNGAYKDNYQAGYSNHGGYQERNAGPSGPSGPNGPSGLSGKYDEYSSHGTQYSGTNTSAGSYNQRTYTEGSYNKGSYNEGPYNKGSYNEGSYNKGSYNEGPYNETTPSVGPDYGYGYERNTAPWDSGSNNYSGHSGPTGSSGSSGHLGKHGGVGGPGWSGLTGW